MDSIENLIYLPTNRPAPSAIAERRRELRHARTKLGLNAALVIIDLSASHSANLEALRDTDATMDNCYLLNRSAMLKYLSLLFSNNHELDSDFLIDYLLRSNINYGSGPNLAALLSATLGAAYLHRRDSDVYFDPCRPNAMPIDLEVAGLAELRNSSSIGAICGTSTFGSPTIDRRPIFAAGFSFGVEFQRAGGAYSSLADAAVEAERYLLLEPRLRYEDDFIVEDTFGRVEMESCALWKLHWLLPEMCSGIIGSDYMVLQVARHRRVDVSFHSRKQLHVHSATRSEADVDSYARYLRRDVQYLQNGVVMRAAVRNLDTKSSSLARQFAGLLRVQIAESSATLAAVRLRALRAIEEATGEAGPRYRELLEAGSESLRTASVQLDDETIRDISEYCTLLESWDAMISAARDLGASAKHELMNSMRA